MSKFEFPFKSCFVITPYGDRIAPSNADQRVDFEFVYEQIVRPALADIVPETARSKDRVFSGVVHEDMFRQILTADVVVCDITHLNANAMYELGIRHAARPSGTIVIQQAGAEGIPFNLNIARIVRYGSTARPADARAPAGGAPNPDVTAAVATLRAYVREALRTRRIDSPVHKLVANLNIVAPSRPLGTVAVGTFPLDVAATKDESEPAGVAATKDAGGVSVSEKLASAPKWKSSPTAANRSGLPRRQIGIAAGNLRDLYDIADVWVNPENTRMEMGPLFGETVSSFIRVLSSDISQQTFGDDPVQSELRAHMKHAATAMPGQAVSTGAGRLETTHGVRRIVHVAAQEGFPLGGFSTVRQVGACVVAALEEVERLNRALRRRWRRQQPLSRVLIPLFGTRNPGTDPIDVATELVLAGKRHLDLEIDSMLEQVLFLAVTDHDLELCETAFRRLRYPVEKIEWKVRSHGEPATR